MEEELVAICKWDPPYNEKWNCKDKKKLQNLKSADIYLNDNAYGQYKPNRKRDVLNSINYMSEEELNVV